MNQAFKKVFVVMGIVVFILTGIAFAQQSKPQPQQQQKAAVKTIFDYRSELKLTDDQVKKIKEHLSELNKEITILRAKLTLVEANLQELLKKDGEMDQIKNKIREAFDIQASIRIADIEATRKINAVMTPEQLKKWRGIQSAARR